jgi:hypothetical protein
MFAERVPHSGLHVRDRINFSLLALPSLTYHHHNHHHNKVISSKAKVSISFIDWLQCLQHHSGPHFCHIGQCYLCL